MPLQPHWTRHCLTPCHSPWMSEHLSITPHVSRIGKGLEYLVGFAVCEWGSCEFRRGYCRQCGPCPWAGVFQLCRHLAEFSMQIPKIFRGFIIAAVAVIEQIGPHSRFGASLLLSVIEKQRFQCFSIVVGKTSARMRNARQAHQTKQQFLCYC